MRLPFTASDASITVFINGRMETLQSDQFNFAALAAHLKQPDHDAAVIAVLVDQKVLLARLTAGEVTVVGDTVYHKGTPIHSALARKLVGVLNAGYDVTPWALFLSHMMDNPSERSRECLYDFIEKFQAPFTPDGCFIAFKRVRDDYTDLHSGQFDNSPGLEVTMPRAYVNDDPDVTCAAGLHVCASSYLGSFYTHSSDCRVIAVKVNPRDVVAVPYDYNSAKMRTCGYVVLGDAEEGDLSVRGIESQAVYTGTGEPPQQLNLGALAINTPVPEIGMRVADQDGDDGAVVALNYGGDSQWVLVRYDDTSYGEVDGVFGPEATGRAAGADVWFSKIVPEAGFQRNHGGKPWTGEEIRTGVEAVGQRQFSRDTGIPRSTLQGWIALIKKAGLWDD